MPSLKVKVNNEAKSAFESYDGPEVPVGNGYEGRIKNVRVKESNAGNLYLNVLVEHETKDPKRKQYNGAPQWVRVMFGEHDETQFRLASFMKAATGKPKANAEANIVDTDVEARAGTGSIVKTIDGVKPDGKLVLFNVRAREAQNGYPASTEADLIRPRTTVAAKDEDEGDEDITEDDIEVEADEEDEDGEELTREERSAQLKKEAIKDLRTAAKEADIDTAGLKKAELVEAILDWEFESDEDEDEESEEEEEETEEVEVDEDEEEDEEDEEDPEAELRAELADLDRAALKTRLKEADESAKVLKKDSDDDLRDKIVAAELTSTPF
jgi:hypothetical protein